MKALKLNKRCTNCIRGVCKKLGRVADLVGVVRRVFVKQKEGASMKRIILTLVVLCSLINTARADFTGYYTWSTIHSGHQLADALMCATQGFFHTSAFNGLSMSFACDDVINHTFGSATCTVNIQGYGTYTTYVDGRIGSNSWYNSNHFTSTWLGGSWGNMNFQWNQPASCGGGVCNFEQVSYGWSYGGSGSCTILEQQSASFTYARFWSN